MPLLHSQCSTFPALHDADPHYLDRERLGSIHYRILQPEPVCRSACKMRGRYCVEAFFSMFRQMPLFPVSGPNVALQPLAQVRPPQGEREGRVGCKRGLAGFFALEQRKLRLHTPGAAQIVY